MCMWRTPAKYLGHLRGVAGVISPDFSVYRNMPIAQQIAHTYQNQLLGARMKADGFRVIANIRLSGRGSTPYALAGAPRRSTIALGLHGCTRDKFNRRHVIGEVRIIGDGLVPQNLVVYGSAAFCVLDYRREVGIPVQVFQPDTFDRSLSREESA